MERPSNHQEKSVESIPTREEILLEIGKYVQNLNITEERKDEKGVCFLRVEVAGQEGGEVSEYTYVRKGDFPEMVSERTAIFIVYKQSGEVVGAEDKAHYDALSKKWEHL